MIAMSVAKSPSSGMGGLTLLLVDAFVTLLPRFCHDPSTTMKIQLRLVFADGYAASKRFWVRSWLSADRRLQFGHYDQLKKRTKDGR